MLAAVCSNQWHRLFICVLFVKNVRSFSQSALLNFGPTAISRGFLLASSRATRPSLFLRPQRITRHYFVTMGGASLVRSDEKMGLKQLFDEESSTYTYLLWDPSTKDAVLVDPVDVQVERDLKEVNDLGLKLSAGINTHAHADHITGTFLLRQKVDGFRSMISEASGAKADVHIKPGDRRAPHDSL